MCQAKYANFVHEYVSNCSLCQVENERFWSKFTLKKRNGVKPNQPKNQFLKSLSEFGSLKIQDSKRENLSKSKPINPKFSQTARPSRTPKFSQATKTVNLKILSKTDCVSSGNRNMAYNVGSYTQVRIAGDFLSSRKAA